MLIMKTFSSAANRALVSIVIALAVVSGASGETTFTNITDGAGLTGMANTATAWGDYNNDGWTDLHVNGVLWRNNAGQGFVKVTGTPFQSGSAIWGDYDNDGYLDLYNWDNKTLYHNVGGTSFIDATSKLPTLPAVVSRGAVWGDFDGDSYLDLYVGGYEDWNAGITYPSLILMNNKGENFRLAWSEVRYRARGVTACDFDRDGDLDIYVSNYRLQPNILWLNDGTGHFTDVAAAYGVDGDGDREAWGHTIGSCWGDLDNDGRIDLFVGNFSHPPDYQDRPKFMRNLGLFWGCHFQDKSDTAGLRWQESYASPALGDYDNDGYLDLFYTTVYTEAGDTPVLYTNNGNWTFREVTSEAGVADLGPTYQAAWADFDNDGDLDLVSDGKLFINNGGTNHWLKVRLVGGNRINHAAIGAQVRVALGSRRVTRQVEGATGEGNQNDLTLHFGLGQYSGPVSLEVLWPGKTTTKRRLTNVDQTVVIDSSQNR